MARTHAHCTYCNREYPVIEMTYYPAGVRGRRAAYQCRRCASFVESHYSSNNETVGKVKSEPWTMSVELETSYSTSTGRAELMSNRFLPTYDCTVDIEYLSPIYNGFGGFVKYAKTIERLCNEGDLLIDYRCGTHCHIGYGSEITQEYLDLLFRYRGLILRGAENYMSAHVEEMTAFFGRPFSRDWANRSDRTNDRYQWVNFLASTGKTIEFRLNFFQNAAQYSRLIMTEKKMVATMMKHFPKALLAADVTAAERAAAAEKTGRYIERIIRKALSE